MLVVHLVYADGPTLVAACGQALGDGQHTGRYPTSFAAARGERCQACGEHDRHLTGLPGSLALRADWP